MASPLLLCLFSFPASAQDCTVVPCGYGCWRYTGNCPVHLSLKDGGVYMQLSPLHGTPGRAEVSLVEENSANVRMGYGKLAVDNPDPQKLAVLFLWEGQKIHAGEIADFQAERSEEGLPVVFATALRGTIRFQPGVPFTIGQKPTVVEAINEGSRVKLVGTTPKVEFFQPLLGGEVEWADPTGPKKPVDEQRGTPVPHGVGCSTRVEKGREPELPLSLVVLLLALVLYRRKRR